MCASVHRHCVFGPFIGKGCKAVSTAVLSVHNKQRSGSYVGLCPEHDFIVTSVAAEIYGGSGKDPSPADI